MRVPEIQHHNVHFFQSLCSVDAVLLPVDECCADESGKFVGHLVVFFCSDCFVYCTHSNTVSLSFIFEFIVPHMSQSSSVSPGGASAALGALLIPPPIEGAPPICCILLLLLLLLLLISLSPISTRALCFF